MRNWNTWVVIGWMIWIFAFLGIDFTVWMLHNPHIPTFSRVFTRLLPWWLVVPAAFILFVHLTLMYRR